MPMLQEFSTHLIVPEPSEELISNEPWSIEIYADGLMDDLFADIDDILDGSGTLSTHTVRYGSRKPQHSREEISANNWYYSDYEPLATLNIPQIVLPNTFNRSVQAVPQVRNPHASTVVVDAPTMSSHPRKPKTIRHVLKKLVILGTAIGIAIAGTIYLFKSEAQILLTGKLTPQNLGLSKAQVPTRVNVEADLAEYILSSLAIIDQQGTAAHLKSFRTGINRLNSQAMSVANANSLSVGNLPSPLIANNTAPIPNRSANNVVERIYIPVYQAPSPMRYGLPRIPGTPLTLPPVTAKQTTQPDAVTTALNHLKQPAKPVSTNVLAAVRPGLKPVAVRTTPITIQQSASPIPALPVAPLRTVSSQVASLVASPTTTQQVFLANNSQPAPSHTLEGLLELGNKSAALFQVDGVTRRINIGETIGSSGWTLVDVNNGEAIVRRNGEVRSIYTGQKL